MQLPKKMAILRVTPDAVRQLLQLPPEVEVLRVEVEHGRRGGLNVVIEGAGWDTPEGGAIFATHGTVTVKEDPEGFKSYRLDWGFPAEGSSATSCEAARTWCESSRSQA